MKLFKSLFALIVLSIASFALAGDDYPSPCDGGCFDVFQTVEISGFSGFGGYGAGTFTGEDGGVLINKDGYSTNDLTLDVSGDLCGADCQSGSFSFNATAGESLTVLSGASGTTSGDMVSTFNEGGTFSAAGFSFGKLNIESDQ